MAIRVEDLPRFSVDQYLRMADGDPAAFERTELIDGVILNVSPRTPLHARAAPWIWGKLAHNFPGRALAGATVVFDSTVREPDVVVMDLDWRFDELGPVLVRNVLLAVEVSVTTTERDLGEKLRDYAVDDVPVYWVVNPRVDGWLMIHTLPTGNFYADVKRIELPDGYEGLDFNLLKDIVE